VYVIGSGQLVVPVCTSYMEFVLLNNLLSPPFQQGMTCPRNISSDPGLI